MRLKKINDSETSAKKLRFADNIDVKFDFVVPPYRIGNFFCGLHRDSALVDNHPILFEHYGNLTSDLLDVSQIDAAIGLSLGRNGDEYDLGFIDSVLDTAGKLQATRRHIPQNQLL